jgi:hypothetical protein
VVQLASDAAGNLFVLWLSSGSLELASSRNGGRSWSPPLVVSPPGLHNILLPSLAAARRGAVGVVFYASSSPSAKQLSGYISQTGDALARSPLFYGAAVNDPAHPIFDNYGDSDSPRADFIGAAYDAGGRLWGGLVEQLGPPDSSNRIPTTGYVAHLAPRASQARAAAAGTHEPHRGPPPHQVPRRAPAASLRPGRSSGRP